MIYEFTDEERTAVELMCRVTGLSHEVFIRVAIESAIQARVKLPEFEEQFKDVFQQYVSVGSSLLSEHKEYMEGRRG